jgi:hypothetical protein
VRRRRGFAADLAITTGFLLVAIAAIVQAREWPFRTALFPLGTGFVLLGAAALKLVVDLAAVRRRSAAEKTVLKDDETEDEAEQDVFVTAKRAEWISALGWMSSFFLMLWLLGALVTIPLYALLYLVAWRESVLVAGIYALASWLFVYGLFDRLLHVPLPAGVLLAGF